MGTEKGERKGDLGQTGLQDSSDGKSVYTVHRVREIRVLVLSPGRRSNRSGPEEG